MASVPRPLIGLIAGVAAGLVASAAMAAVASALPLIDQDGADPDPAPATDTPDRLHYVVGAVMGGIYGVLTEYRPEASAGFSSAYGVAAATLLEAAPDAEPDDGAASAVVFGLVLEGIRRLIAGKR